MKVDRIYQTKFGFTIDLDTVCAIDDKVDLPSQDIGLCINGVHSVYDYANCRIDDTEGQKRLDEFIERWTAYKNHL